MFRLIGKRSYFFKGTYSYKYNILGVNFFPVSQMKTLPIRFIYFTNAVEVIFLKPIRFFPQETAYLVTFTEETRNGKLHFWCTE